MVLLQKPSSRSKPPSNHPKPPTPTPSDQLITILADSGCTLLTPTNTPSLPPDLHKFRQSLHTLFTNNPSSLSQFLTGFISFTNSPKNLQIFLTGISSNTSSASQNQTLLRILLLIPSLQFKLQCILLEKLPEVFGSNVCGQIVNHFRYLDFLVDSRGFVEKLLEVLSVCPLELKKEVIGSLPEIIGGDEKNNDNVVESLRQLLEEDKELIVPVLDSFSNLHLSEILQEQVVTIALSFVRTIDVQHMPYLLRFLLLSATHANGRRIISQIRQQLRFVGGVDSRGSVLAARAKGKSVVDNFELLILEALRSSLQFKNVLCQEILNELKSIDKAEDHRVIDVWLLMLIYMNGGTSQKFVEKMIKKKIMDDCLGIALFDQCIHGHRELVQGHFSSFLSLCEYLLACKEQKAREFSNHLYISLFNEFIDTYSRHEILGGLVTHIGSGVAYEVGSALDTMVLLATKYSQELIPFFSYINGILDYIEGFNDENLHKVYEVFSYLALSGRLNSDSVCSSIANELLIIVRKQVSNPDLKYKKMGLIGTLKIVSRLGDVKIATQFSTPQRTDCEESLELLRMALDSCKSFPLPLIMFYDELIALLEHTSLQPVLMEWIGKHAGDFESIFLSDLEGGQLLSKGSFCGLEGELWMNLDGDLSPICLNILPLVSSSLQCSSSLQILPAYFLLLSVVERVTNQGSLGGIDALLGCPLWLPSHKYFGETVWSSLTAKQRQAMCLSLYYASNWIRELLNAFCTQVIGEVDRTSQATRDELISKLSKRLRNLVLLESLLDTSLKLHPLSLPELHLLAENSGSSSDKPNFSMNMEKKNEKSTISQSNSSNKKLKRKISSQSANDKLKQPTILEMLKRAGVSQEVPSDGLPDHLGKSRESQHEETPPSISTSTSTCFIEISAATRVLDGQRFKCRSLSIDTLFLLTFSTAQDTCCADPTAELPLHLYLLRDLCHKLDCLTPQTKQTPAGSLRTPFDNRLIVNGFINKLRKLLPYLRKYFDCAVSFLNGGDDTCGGHWNTQSVAAGNPDIPGLVVSNTVVAGLVFKEVLSCFCKMLNLPDVRMNVPVLTDLLKAFQPINIADSFLSAIQPIPLPGNMDYLYCGAYAFFEGVLDTACSSSVMMASEVLVTLESVVNSAKYFLDKLLEGSGKNMHIGFVQKVIPILRNRLGTCAHKLLTRNWDSENIDNSCKIKGETIQKMVHIYFENSESTADLLEEFVCSVLSQAPSSKTQPTAQDAIHGFPTLCPTTFLVWYRASFEENHSILSKQVKEVSVLEKSRSSVGAESVKKLLKKLHQSVNVVVSLVNMCKTHDKVAVHAMAVKYGGKFVDTFLKVFDFLQAHFGEHSDVIVLLIKELQKATRTIQTLCSEAKGCKRTMITSKIPATKRSMERFLFGVKALLYSTSNGGNFWMGNLKHKDLYGQVVSSQVYPGGDESDEGVGNDPMDQDVEDVVSIASQHDDDDEEEEAEPSDE